jgi:predicted DNA-binding transcriptional regulator YafY
VRASRLLSILMLLQTRGRMSGQELAAAVDVSLATVYRDIDQLSGAGVPVYAERGRTGGFRLQDGWRTRLTGLTVPEAQALFMAGLPGPASELGLGEVMEAAQLKLVAALPADWQGDARRMSSRFHLDPVGWFQSVPAQPDHLPAVAAAVWNEQRLRIRYESWNGVSEREIEPLGFVLKAGIWYVVALTGGESRTYRLSSIRELTVLADRFVRPPNFDLARYWTASTQSFQAGLYREAAAIRISAEGLRRLYRLGAAVQEAAARNTEPPDAEGWTRLTIPIESVDQAVGELLKLGPEVEVLEPPALRERLSEIARRFAALYLG